METQAKNVLFEAEFQKEVDRQIANKQATAGAPVAVRLGIKHDDPRPNQRFIIAGDDEDQTLMWRSFLKTCAFYYDVPSVQDENLMRTTLQSKYDSILQPGWRAPLTTRRDLLTWACGQLNTNLEIKEIETRVDCENYNHLLSNFGPDYDKLRPKLGYIRGLFD